MVTILNMGLVVSLVGPMLYVLATRRLELDSLSLPGRLVFWLLAAVALVCAAHGDGAWRVHIGARTPEWLDLFGAVVAIMAMLAGAVLLAPLLVKLGFGKGTASELQKQIIARSIPHKCFIVITAAVTEEILYRGYAIGIGREILGSLPTAFMVSLALFVAAHFRHGAKALPIILWISLANSFLFVMTGNLFACILAHLVIDVMGTMYFPWVASRQRARAASQAGEA